MARRRFQKPSPQRRGKHWIIQVRRDVVVNGQRKRVNERIKLCSAEEPEREAERIAAETLRPLNQNLETIEAAVTNFTDYVENTYIPLVLPLLAATTRDRYEGVIRNHLIPEFGKLYLRNLTTKTIQKFFSGMASSELSHESRDKIRDVLSSILRSAVQYEVLLKNPVEAVQLPKCRKGKSRTKPHITPEQFERLLARITEPYATMIFVAVYTGLRISELIALRWEDVHTDSISIDERYCRGDWAEPKTASSNATIGVDPAVIDRIQRLKLLTVDVKAGRATRHYKLVKSDRPEDLVFQSVRTGAPMVDNNILCRHIKPAGRELGIPWVNWRCLRTSYATWLVEAGADPKSVQGQLRHSRISTTMDIYAQFVPEAQRLAVSKMSAMVGERRAQTAAELKQLNLGSNWLQ